MARPEYECSDLSYRGRAPSLDRSASRFYQHQCYEIKLSFPRRYPLDRFLHSRDPGTEAWVYTQDLYEYATIYLARCRMSLASALQTIQRSLNLAMTR